MKKYSFIEEAVLRTLSYSEVFSFALSIDEVYTYLISHKKYTKKEVIASIDSLVAKKKILKEHEYVALLLRGKGFSNERKIKEQISKEKMKRAAFAVRIFSKIPSVLGIFITGGVSVLNASQDDDIDFMIITKSGYLWITRLIIVCISKVLGKYRQREYLKNDRTSLNNTWCLNLWIDESRMQIEEQAQNIYTAHEVVQAKPVYEKELISSRFLSKNVWVHTYVPNILIPTIKEKSNYKESSLFEKLCFSLQYLYMKKHLTSESVTLHKAFFHPRDTSHIVSQKHEEILLREGIAPYPPFTMTTPPSSVYMERMLKKKIAFIHTQRMNGKKVVLATGVFDLLHAQHIHFLENAKKQADILVVAIESDKRARALKGKGRPIESETKRLKKVSSLSCVDVAFVLPNDFSNVTRYMELLYQVRPDIYACSEHTLHQESKSALVQKYGGVLKVVHSHVKGISTTEILKNNVKHT